MTVVGVTSGSGVSQVNIGLLVLPVTIRAGCKKAEERYPTPPPHPTSPSTAAIVPWFSSETPSAGFHSTRVVNDEE